MNRSIISLIVSAICLSACATRFQSPSEASPVPAERLTLVSRDVKDAATVVFFMEMQYVPMPLNCVAHADDMEIGVIKHGERMTVKLPEGEYVFGVRPAAFRRNLPTTIAQRLEANKTYYYRVSGVCEIAREFVK